MKPCLTTLALSPLVLIVGLSRVPADQPATVPFPQFRMQEIETSFTVGYAVSLVDVNHDGKPDIVVVDSRRVVWYENPTWKRRTIIEGQTAPDNVCIAPLDIDGDGKVDFALGAAWAPANTKGGGTLQWLKRGKTLDEPWTVYPIGSEPTVHRIRWADVDGDGKPELVVVPLFGRGSSNKTNWMDVPVRILAYKVPQDPTRDRWVPDVVDESLHVIHNFWPIPAAHGKGQDLLTASYEGVNLLTRDAAGKRHKVHLGVGNQDNPKSNRGASEIKEGKLKNGRKFIATVEPWHGNQIVVYTQPDDPKKLWDRHVIDDHLRWGHAVWCADLDGDGNEELIIGARDQPGAKDTFKEQRGVRVYKVLDDRGARWARSLVDNGGMSCEDLAVADLNGDGRPDIVAVGRFTHNARIYWNEGAPR